MVEAEDGEAGTTLVELLVGLALLSLIALAVGDGIGVIRRMLPVAQRIDAEAEINAAREHLRRTIGEGVADLLLVGGAPFLGEADGLRFLAPADPLLEVGGLNEITLSLEAEPGGRIDLVEHRRIASGDLARGGSRTVLVPNVRALRLRYGEALADAGLAWHEDWRRTGSLPALVRIELDLPAGDRRRFPDLLVHPVASPAPRERQGPVSRDAFEMGGLASGR